MPKRKEVKFRRSWGVLNPATRRIESKRRYVRARDKKVREEE